MTLLPPLIPILRDRTQHVLPRGNWLGLPLAGVAASGIFTGITRLNDNSLIGDGYENMPDMYWNRLCR